MILKKRKPVAELGQIGHRHDPSIWLSASSSLKSSFQGMKLEYAICAKACVWEIQTVTSTTFYEAAQVPLKREQKVVASKCEA